MVIYEISGLRIVILKKSVSTATRRLAQTTQKPVLGIWRLTTGQIWGVQKGKKVFIYSRLVESPCRFTYLCCDLIYDGRYQIEINFDEVKELGLGHYQGRSGQGVRRWPLFLCVAQLLLKLIATGGLTMKLPTLNWPWYDRNDTVGQVRRRLIDLCRPRISCPKGSEAKMEKFPLAA